MKLGPIQEAWVKSLEEHPERQMMGELGRGELNHYKACCLGECKMVMYRAGLCGNPIEDGTLRSGKKIKLLSESDRRKIGLRSGEGHAKDEPHFSSLASMNDRGKTWPNIAAIIRENPDRFFFKSV